MTDSRSAIAHKSVAPEFLPRELRERLVNKFFLFKEDREKVHRRMESYVLDFQLHDRTQSATQRHGELEERYSVDAPKLTHLTFREGDETALWDMRDIAIVLGRSPSSVTRVFQRMRGNAEFAERVDSLSVTPVHPGRDAATLYEGGVFDAIVDYYEHAYLERITRPRHGTPLNDEGREAVKAFWRELKNRTDEDIKDFNDALFAPALTPTKTASFFSALYAGLRMIFRRVFSVKAGTCFLVLFGIIWEICRRWPWLDVALPVVSVLGLIVTLVAMLRRKGYTPWLADAGAGAVILCLIWTLTLFIDDSPVNRLLSREPEPVLEEQFDAEKDRAERTAAIERRLIELREQIGIEESERVKKTLESNPQWITFSNYKEKTNVNTSRYLRYHEVAIEKIIYGIDTETPDREYRPSEYDLAREREEDSAQEKRMRRDGARFPDVMAFLHTTGFTLYRSEVRVNFVSVQIVFKDGTSSEVRIFRNNNPDRMNS